MLSQGPPRYSRHMALMDLVTMPLRVGAAATQVTLTLGELVAPEGPVRREGGYAERLMAVIGEGGHVERVARVLSDPRGPMMLLNALAAAMAPDRPLGRALARDGALDRLLAEDGTLERLTSEGGTLDQLVALGATLEAIAPRLQELGAVVPELHRSVDTLSDAVGPIGELAGRLPGARRKTLSAAPSREPDNALF